MNVYDLNVNKHTFSVWNGELHAEILKIISDVEFVESWQGTVWVRVYSALTEQAFKESIWDNENIRYSERSTVKIERYTKMTISDINARLEARGIRVSNYNEYND